MYRVKKETLGHTKSLVKNKVRRDLATLVLNKHPETLNPLAYLLENTPRLEMVVPKLLDLYNKAVQTFESENKMLICGNGGSMTDAQHIAGELNKSFKRRRSLPVELKKKFTKLPHGTRLADKLESGLPTIALGTNPSILTAVSNDIDYDFAFAQELYVLGKRGDLFLGISTSGESPNVVLAAEVALATGLTTVGLTGKEGGELAKLADLAIKVPADSVNLIQQFHQAIYHALCGMLEEHFYA